MSAPKKYWFPAKRYGWGWGLPATWQGWLVLGAYVAGAVALAVGCPPDTHKGVFFSGIVGLSLLLVVICWRKGEPPRWRWGDHDT